MLICLDMRTGAGCGKETVDHARFCEHCGQNLRFALMLHDAGTLVGRYRVGRVIGYGGFGAIYEAQSNAGEQVALKETFDTSSIKTFAREFAVLSRLSHANLPRYIDMFEAEGNGYLVMEYVPGQSLQDILDELAAQGAQNERLPESQVLGYAIQLCDVLYYLHSQQPAILHRDVKPANIRLTPQGRIKLVDFGLLKQGGQQTRATIRGLGTLGYAPIEQYANDERATNPRSDVYSLGATLFHLLTGTQPTSAPVRIAGTPDSLPALRDLRLDVSPHVANSITQAMNLLPKDRFATMQELKQALLGGHISDRVGPSAEAGLEQSQKAVTTEQKETAVAPTAPLQRVASWFKSAFLPSQTTNAVNPESTMRLDSPSIAPAITSLPNFVPAPHEMSLPHLLCNTEEEILAIAYTPLDDKLIGISSKGMLYEWWVSDGKLAQTHQLPGVKRVNDFAYSPNGETFATISNENNIRIWNAVTRELSHKRYLRDSSKMGDLRYSPNGKLLVAILRNQELINVWQVSDGNPLYSNESFSHKASSAAFSPNNLLLALGAKHPFSKIYLYRAAYGQLLRKTKQRTSVYSLAWHPNSELFASGGSRKITIWRAKDGERVQEFVAHSSAIRHLLWHPSGKWLISGSEDKSVCIWALEEPFLQYKLMPYQGYIAGLALAPDGRTLAVSNKQKNVRLWLLPERYQIEVPARTAPLDEFTPAQLPSETVNLAQTAVALPVEQSSLDKANASL